MEKYEKMCVKVYVEIFQGIPWQKNRFLQHVQKTEHINLAWIGIPYAAQRKLFPKCNFFPQESTKVIQEEYFFYQKVRDFHFLCHLIWPRWFSFLVHEFWLIIAEFYPLYKRDGNWSSVYSSKNGGGYIFLQKREKLVK